MIYTDNLKKSNLHRFRKPNSKILIVGKEVATDVEEGIHKESEQINLEAKKPLFIILSTNYPKNPQLPKRYLYLSHRLHHDSSRPLVSLRNRDFHYLLTIEKKSQLSQFKFVTDRIRVRCYYSFCGL